MLISVSEVLPTLAQSGRQAAGQHALPSQNSSFGRTGQPSVCCSILSFHLTHWSLTILLTQLSLYVFDSYCLIKAQALRTRLKSEDLHREGEGKSVSYPAIDKHIRLEIPVRLLLPVFYKLTVFPCVHRAKSFQNFLFQYPLMPGFTHVNLWTLICYQQQRYLPERMMCQSKIMGASY